MRQARAKPGVIPTLALLCAGLLAGASLARAGVVRHDTDDAVYRGLARSPDFAPVGRILTTTPTQRLSASGTLIGDRWVLTAGHVLGDARSLTFALDGSTYHAQAWTAHPDWTGDLSSGVDLGLIRLDRPVAGVAPATLYDGSAGGERGRSALLVGYGMTGTGLTGAHAFDAVKRAGTNVIDGYAGARQQLLRYDFDLPGRWGRSASRSPRPMAAESLIAPGDSGGALFIDTADGRLLAGVHSFGFNPYSTAEFRYGDSGASTRVAPYLDWIDSVLTGRSPLTNSAPSAIAGTARPAVLVLVPEPMSLALLTAASLLAARRRPR